MKLFIILFSLSLISCSSMNSNHKNIIVSTENLKKHVNSLVGIPLPRNYINVNSLNIAADYIDSVFQEYSSKVEIQSFLVGENEYKNIRCFFGPEDSERIIVGAHYDVCMDQPGADDNTSGVAGLLEIARLLRIDQDHLNHQVEVVAYTLEEPPFFRTKSMGSAVHAKHLSESDVSVKVMICLEMIGYFTDEPNSQRFPIGFLKWFYPTTGNFIAVVSNLKSHFIASDIKSIMRDNSKIGVFQLTSPSFLPGIDFSDHLNYWNHGYKAVMITDTAFYRNLNYHEESDTIETLNFDKMAEVVKGVYSTLVLI